MNEDEHSQFSMYSALTNSENSSKGMNLSFFYIPIMIDNIDISSFLIKRLFSSY